MKYYVRFLLIVCFFAGITEKVFSQIIYSSNPIPCSAPTLSPNGSSFSLIAGNTGFMPWNSCGGGTIECYPSFVAFRPSSSSITFKFATSSIIGGTLAFEYMVASTEANSCNFLWDFSCAVGVDPIFKTTNLVPGDLYFLRVNGVGGCSGNVQVTYNPKELLGVLPRPTVSGPNQVCLNSISKYTAASSIFNINDYKWTLVPSNAGTITKVAGTTSANLKITNLPTNGKVQLKVEPIFTGQAAPTITPEIIDIDVIDLKPATCNVKICPEERPLLYEIRNCIRNVNPAFSGTPNPEFYNINLAPGTSKTQVINYAVVENGCKGTVTLNTEVYNNKTVTLNPLLLCDGETKNIKGQDFTCSDASNVPKKFQIFGNPPFQCDSSYEMIVQCLKINPKIAGVGSLDCSNTQLTLTANNPQSTTLPNNITNQYFTGVGTRAYAWSRNGAPIASANQASLIVTQSGTYEVTLTYTYQITATVNNAQVIVSKTCSKSTSVQITSNGNIPIAETPLGTVAIPCADSIVKYSINPDINATDYTWSVVGATIISKNQNPQGLVEAFVKNNGSTYQVCLVKNACQQISAPNCITVNAQNCVTSSTLTANAGTMNLRFIITAPTTKGITASHKKGTQTLGANDIAAYVLHEGNSNKIVNMKAINLTGTFSFDSTLLSCNKVYYISYVVGKNVSGLPDLNDKSTSIVPKGQPISWLCKIKSSTAALRENQIDKITQITDNEVFIYPSIASSILNIEFKKAKRTTLMLRNIQGNVVKEITTEQDTQIDISELPNGMIFCEIWQNNQPISTKKIVIQH